MGAAIERSFHDLQRIVLPVLADHCEVPILWRGYKRICGPQDSGVTPAEAAGRVIRALGLAPTSAVTAPVPSPNVETKEEAVERGKGLYAQQRYEETLDAFDHALALDPQFARAWNNKGITLLRLGRYEEALASFEQTLNIDPQSAQTWNNIGITLDNLKRYEEALITYDHVVTLVPQNAAAWYDQGMALDRLKRYEEALAAYNRALTLDTQFARAWDGKITMLYVLDRANEARLVRKLRDVTLTAH